MVGLIKRISIGLLGLLVLGKGLTVSYSVYSASPKSPNEPDLYLLVEYKNMAALDGLDAKMNAISAKVFGSVFFDSL